MEKAAVSLDCVCERAFASGMDDAGHLLSSSARSNALARSGRGLGWLLRKPFFNFRWANDSLWHNRI